MQTRIRENGEYAFKKILIPELHRGDVHTHRTERQARLHPGLSLLTRLTKDPVANRENQATVLGNGNELCRRDRPSSGMRPAYQCFRARNFSGPQIDLWLVVHHEFLAF